MEVPTGRRWIAFSLLAVVLPVSLLATLRLTGILPEPPMPETIVLDEVRWQMERPNKYVPHADEKIENAYLDDSISITASLSIHEYFENSMRRPYEGRDGIGSTLEVDATASEGFITSIAVEFLRSDDNSTIYITQTFSSYHNAVVTRIKGIGISTGVTYIEAKVHGSPCGLQIPVEWVFNDENIEDHHLIVSFMVTYFDEQTYWTAVAPIILDVLIATT